MKDINFLSGKAKSAQSSDTTFIKTIIMLIICIEIALSVLVYVYFIFQIGRFNNEQIEINADIARYSEVANIKKNIDSLNNRINDMTEVIGIVSNHYIINTQLIKEISSVMPDNMFLMNYSVSKSGDVNLEGISKDEKSIAYFAHKLKETELFNDVVVKSINNDTGEGQSQHNYNFVVIVKIKS